MSQTLNFPVQKLPYQRKNQKWRTKCVEWAENYVWSWDSRVRKSLQNKIINYNLLNGRISLEDIEVVLNPNNIRASFIPDNIQHYPIINSKLNVLLGEESKRRFDWRLIVTNPDAISEIEENKKQQWMQDLSQWVTADAKSQDEAMQDLQRIQQYNKYEWKDIREIRGNYLLTHYIKELSIPLKFNRGFLDAMAVGEEAYQCDIAGGEPTFERINPAKMIVLKSGFTNRLEDADMIVLWDFWSPGKIIDTYYDVLQDKDIEYISQLPFVTAQDEMDTIDPRQAFTFIDPLDAPYGEGAFVEGQLFSNNVIFNNNYTDNFGNVRIVRLYWKSYRKVLKVKSYNFETGEEEYNFYPETYIPNEIMGEESTPLWILEAWEGTRIGKDVYVNMRPKVVQYNRLSNPSRCHFGIVGSIYNMNDNKPFSLVDMAKPYNYLYDVIHDRLNKNLAANWGKIAKLDLALVPQGWDIDKWMYYAKVSHLAVVDSFKEGSKGQATGKLAGMMNNQSSGSIDADQGGIIQQDINLLSFIKQEMAEVIGVSPQREGQIEQSETVGGVERSVLQSSHITEWLFMIHDDVKKRALECFLETAKAALKGKQEKFQYQMSDGAYRVMDIDGDEFAECDYGLVVDNADDISAFLQKFESYAQAMIQNQTIQLSTLLKVWNGSSIADITRSVEEDERQTQQNQQQQQQQEQEMQQQQLQQQAQTAQEQQVMQNNLNQRDNDTKILVAQIQAAVQQEATEAANEQFDPNVRDELAEKIRQFNANHQIKIDKLAEEKRQHNVNNQFTREKIQIQRDKPTNTKSNVKL